MPIQGLTNAPKAFMKLGQIRKGDRGGKNNAPRDLDHFRVTFQPGKLAEALEAEFRRVYGDNPTEINARFADPNPSEVWDANYECYKKGGLIAKAYTDDTGAHWLFYRDPDSSEVLVRDGSPVGSEGRDFFDKPFTVDTPIYYNTAKEPVYLEPVGRLQIVIPELAHLAVGYFTFQPTSPRDIRNITTELAAFAGIAKSYGGTITGIPFKIIRRAEEVTKNIDGKLSKGTSWVVHLDAGGEWGTRAIEAIERLALPEVIEAEYSSVESDQSEFPEYEPEPKPAPVNAPLLNAPLPVADPNDEPIDPLSEPSVKWTAQTWNMDTVAAAKEIGRLVKAGKVTVPMGKKAFKAVIKVSA